MGAKSENRIAWPIPVCVLLAMVFAIQHRACADTLWRVGESSPIFGIIKSSNDQSIVFDQTSDGKTFETVTLARNAISSTIVNYDSERLSSLVGGDWKPWGEYAEELISQKQDPVARNLAMRLLVIIAGNSKNSRQRQSALNDLIALAEDDSQREKLLMLRYLETGQKQPAKDSAQQAPLPGAGDRAAAAKMVQLIRRGGSVNRQLTSEQIKKTVSAFEHVCTWQELVQISKSNRIDDQELKRLVALEYELRAADSKANVRSDGGSWHLQASRVIADTVTLPTIKTATGFDPEETRFVDGQWKK